MPMSWSKFFWDDYLSDAGLRSVSAAARGVWMDMLCVMAASPRRGVLLTATGKQLSMDALARLCGESPIETLRLVNELGDAGVFSKKADSGEIYSRRMVRDYAEYLRSSTTGRIGGLISSRARITPPLEAPLEGNPRPPLTDPSSTVLASRLLASRSRKGESEGKGGHAADMSQAFAEAGVSTDYPTTTPPADAATAVDPEIDAALEAWFAGNGSRLKKVSAGVCRMDAARWAEADMYGREITLAAIRWGTAEHRAWRSVHGRARSLAETAGWVGPKAAKKPPEREKLKAW